ncbi:MAG: type II CAAX endopeptidase family protein [bacterium]
MKIQQLWKSLGPILLSALSLFVSSLVIQSIGQAIDPTFSLCSNRGLGKITLTVLVMLHIIALLFFQSRTLIKAWLETNFLFFKSTRWLKTFFLYFIAGFSLHALLLALCFGVGVVEYNQNLPVFKITLLARLAFGLVATFFLAWTEELIFRGTLYPFFAQHLPCLTSTLLTSIIFVFAHTISGTLTLPLGIGLFLLGFSLNIVFITTGKLYAGMGIHAGLVFVKVVLRRIPLFQGQTPDQWPWWFAQDLRQAPLIHILFLLVILILLWRYRRKLHSKVL